MITRIITNLNHGAFFGIGSIVAASLAPCEKQASAVSAMFMGLAIANIGGIHVATWFWQVVWWLESFMDIALLGVAAMLSLGTFLPKSSPQRKAQCANRTTRTNTARSFSDSGNNFMGAGAIFTLYTYIVLSLESITQVSPGYVTGMLVLIGIGFTLGAKLGGKLADRSVKGSLMIFLSLIASV
ncbi:MAG: MFS transporter [Candidatus Malihini olakiniferum]